MSNPPGHCKDFSASADRKVQHLPRESFHRKKRWGIPNASECAPLAARSGPADCTYPYMRSYTYIYIYIGCEIRPHSYR